MAAAQPASLLAQAAALLRAGRPSDAIVPLRQAARLRPADPAIHHDLGVACLESGLPVEAIAAFRNAVAASPRHARAYLRIGIAQEMLGDPPAAIDAYRQAATLLPSLVEAQYRAGNLLDFHGHATEALACFRRGAASTPKTSLGRVCAARALLAEGRDADAGRVLRQALVLDPKNAGAADLLGTIQADSGRFDEARASYERAIKLAPALAGSYYDLVRCRRITPEDAPLVARMEAALAGGTLDAGQRIRVHLALGKAFDDLGNHGLAMRHFDAASTLREALAPFDLAAFEGQVDALVARFTPDRIAGAVRFGSPDPTPVLIVGLPRSGTTLLEQIISSHPDVVAGGELSFWTERGAEWGQAGDAGTEAPFLGQAASDYLATLRALAPAAARVTDKMPFNLLQAGLIHLALPAATIIHCRRDKLDTALSIRQTHFNPRLGFPTGGLALAGYIRACDRLADHWRRVLPADRFIDIGYEALATDPEPHVRRLVESCGLPWDPACLHPERNPRIVRTASKWQARQAINADSVGRWRRYEPWLGEFPAFSDDSLTGNAVTPGIHGVLLRHARELFTLLSPARAGTKTRTIAWSAHRDGRCLRARTADRSLQ